MIDYTKELKIANINADKYQLAFIVARILRSKNVYMAVSYSLLEKKMLFVPWEIIATIHFMETSLRFNRHLHNGDPLTDRTVRVPSGKPEIGEPPFTWEESAFDAISDFYYIDKVNNYWGANSTLEFLERWNGLGYRKKKLYSPYLWAGTNLESDKIYVEDGKIEENNSKSSRIGCYPILKELDFFGFNHS